MDRNQLIGLTLISVMLITYAQFFAPQPPARPATTQEAPTASVSTSPEEEAPRTLTPTSLAHYGRFAPAMQGTEKEVVLENEVMKVTLTTRGGRVKEVMLKNYQDHQGQPLSLLDDKSSRMGFQFSTQGLPLNTSDLFFETGAQDQSVQGESKAQTTFTLALGPGQYLRQVFTLPGKGYTLTHTWEMVGLAPVLDQPPLQFVWHDRIKRAEKDIEACRNKTTINYYLASGKFKYLKERSEKQQEQELQRPIQWVGIKQRFFTAGIIAQEAFTSGHVATTPTPQSTTTVKEARVSLTVPTNDPQQDQEGQFTFYFGPNDYKTLQQVAPGFSKNISLGWPVFRWINRFLIIPVFAFLEQYISSYGIIIVLLVLFMKSLLLPLSYHSYLAMAKMRVLKPALEGIKAKHGEDMQKIQLEQMTLYREMGINPLSGCIPMLLQMPILIAMFNFFPDAIALRQQAFLWASDLSTYDSVLQLPFSIPLYGSHVSLFTLLMTASTILYTWSNNQLTAPQEGPMKAMTYLMPLTFMFILNKYPAGLSFYYFVSNLVTFGQQSLIQRFVDEEKIKKQLEANQLKNKNRKKSRLQQRLESAMKAAEKPKPTGPKNKK
ncbi:MAG: membrane protein insertase YidC [Bacteroidota bacterium]